ncbi:hypothetical protein NX059_012353 [Plenodomus lindquistii]|nr:hypothetical protein NX059_012353 [Plenodomus lindquistii]
MQHKIRVDRARVGEDVSGYMFNRLKDDAASIGISWMERGDQSHERFWEFLDQQFSDKMLDEKARNKLFTFKQKKQTLQGFNAEFMRLAFDAGEENNHPSLKSRYMNAINADLADRMVSVEVPREWTVQQLMERVGHIEENLYRSKLYTGSHHGDRRGDQGDPMDVDSPATGYSTRPPGAKKARWVTPEERAKRRKDNLCLRCGRAGHMQHACELAPAERPAHAFPAGTRKGKSEETDSASESEN